MASFEVPGWEDFVKRAQGVVDKWEQKKQILTGDLANVYLEETLPLIPVDTSRLVSSFQIGAVTPDYSEVGTNVEYALYVNDGHVQHRRFLPISYLSANGRKKYIRAQKGGKEPKGIMLKEKYIPGVFFLEKGLEAAKPGFKELGESFMEQIGREIEGAGM